MQKTRLGISVGLAGTIMYFMCLFGGYIPALIFFGYILLVENNPWLRKTSAKALLLLIAFSLISTLIGFIPDLIAFLNSILTIFDEYVSLTIVTKLLTVITNAISIIRTVIFLILGIKALNQASIPVPVVDDLTNRNVE